MNTNPQVALWAINPDPAWTGHNAGIPDMVIMSGTLYDVHFARERITLIAKPDIPLEIRNIEGTITYTIKVTPRGGFNPTIEIINETPTRTHKPRRTLGQGTTA